MFDPDALLQRLLLGAAPDESPLTHVEAITASWPEWVPYDVRVRVVARGVAQPWTHQVRRSWWSGCRSCVQPPKCGNGNEPLDKAAALTVLDLVLHELPAVAAW